MFKTYSYKTTISGNSAKSNLQKNLKKKKKKIDQNNFFTAFTNVLFIFVLWLRMYTFVQRISAECLMK